MEGAEDAEGSGEVQTLLMFNPCHFRRIRVIRDNAVHSNLRLVLLPSACSAPSISLRELLTISRRAQDSARYRQHSSAKFTICAFSWA